MTKLDDIEKYKSMIKFIEAASLMHKAAPDDHLKFRIDNLLTTLKSRLGDALVKKELQ